MPATAYFESLLLRYAIYGETFAIDQWFLAFYSTTGATTEITSSSYMRQEVTWTSTAPYTNTNLITFPTYPGGNTTIRALGLCDTATSGNLLVWRALSPQQSLSTGVVKTVAIGALTLDILNT